MSAHGARWFQRAINALAERLAVNCEHVPPPYHPTGGFRCELCHCWVAFLPTHEEGSR